MWQLQPRALRGVDFWKLILSRILSFSVLSSSQPYLRVVKIGWKQHISPFTPKNASASYSECLWLNFQHGSMRLFVPQSGYYTIMPSILTDFVDSLGCSHLTDTPEWRKTQHNSSICEAKTNQVKYKHTKKPTFISRSCISSTTTWEIPWRPFSSFLRRTPVG